MFNKRKILILSCVFFLVFMYLSNKMTDYDYWFHYSCGEWVWQNKTVPQMATWSWYGTENNLEWISHEWLFGLFIYGFVNLFGENAVAILCPTVLSLLAVVVFNFAYDKWEKNPIILVLFLIPLAICFAAVSVPRPQIFMYWMFYALILILFKEEKKHSKTTWLLVPLTILWTNLHGGSYILIFVLYGMLIITKCFNFEFGRITIKSDEAKVNLKRLLIFAIAFIAVAINGHGVKMYIYPLTNMADNVMISSISEWQSLDLNSLSKFNVSALLIMVMYIVFIVGTKKEISAFRFLLSGMWIFLAFKSIRFIPMMAIVLTMTVTEFLDLLKPIEIKELNISLLIILVTLSCASFYRMADFYKEPFDKSMFPSDEMIEKLQELPEGTHLYNEYNIGGYLTYKHVEVFIDGRADIYSHFNMKDYVNAANLNDNIEEYVKKYDFDYMLISDGSKMNYWINSETTIEKEIVFEDDKFILYKLIED